MYHWEYGSLFSLSVMSDSLLLRGTQVAPSQAVEETESPDREEGPWGEGAPGTCVLSSSDR